MEPVLVFDKSSVRTTDQNGHLHVSLTNISKANVCGYLGREIPQWKELGLDSNTIYQMLRDPDELKKAAHTFDGAPLLDTHIAVSAWDHPHGKVVGASGTDAKFEGDYLKNSLVIWTADAIEGIENGQKREISCSYSYDADMTPGTFQGVHYDGVMKNIKANHIALVEQGRAGPDVLVGDEINHLVEDKMEKRYRKATLAKMAEDAKIDKVDVLLALLANDETEEKKPEEKKKAEDEETEEEKEARLKKEADQKKAEDEEETKAEEKKEKAMDAAILKAKEEVKADMRATQEAVELVRPWVGNMVAMDSAEEVYKAALKLKNISFDGVHPSALKAVVSAYMQAEQKPAFVHDAAITKNIAEAVPNLARIKRG